MAVVWVGFSSLFSPLSIGGGGVKNQRPEAGLGFRRGEEERCERRERENDLLDFSAPSPS